MIYIFFVYNKLVNFVIIVAGDGDVFFFSIYFNSIEFNFNIIQNMSQLQFLKDLNLVVKWLNYYLSGCLSVHPSFSLSERLSDWVCEWMSLSGFCWVRVLYIFVFNKIALSLFVPERDFHTFYFSFFHSLCLLNSVGLTLLDVWS